MELTATLLAGTVLVIGGVLGLGVGYVARRQRDHPAAGPLSMMAIPPGLAGLCTAGVVLAPQLPAARVPLAAATWLLSVTPAYFLLFTLVYTGRQDLITPRRRRLLVAFYGTVGAVAMLEPLVLAEATVRTVGGLALPVIESRTRIVLVVLLTVYPLIGVCFVLLGRFLISPRNMYRRQTAVIMLAAFTPVVGSVVFEAGFSPHPGLNLTGVFFTVEAIIIALALFRVDFLSVEPVAPDIVLEEMDDPVIVLDESDALIDANPAAAPLFDGQTPIGTPIDQYLPGLLAAAAAGEEYVPSERVAMTDGGEVEVYDLNDTPIRDQYDRDRGSVVVLRDVSLQKRRERTLASLQSVSQQFLGAESREEVMEIAVTTADELLEYPYSGAMAYDADENVLRPAVFTDTLAEAFGGADTIVSQVVEPGDNDTWQVFESGEPMLGKPIEDPEGKLPAELGESLLYPLGDHGVLGISADSDHDGFSDSDRRFVGTLATTTENALDRVQKERELRESRELVETRSEQLRFFNSALRHDLLNGLMVVQGHVDRLDALVDGEAADRVKTIDDWTQDLARMAKEVRSMTQTVAGETDGELEAVDLTEVLTEKVEKFRRGHDALTITDETGPLPPVRADSMLGSVVENVFLNAVEHNDSETPAIDVTASVDAESVTLRIGDNGPGVGDERKEVIFDETVTSEASGSVGFGLYFVGVMLERYGGDVWFEDRNDGRDGVVAVIELPRADAVT